MTLVFVHGLGASAQQFSDFYDLASDSLRLICVNMPGHGPCFHDPKSAPVSFAAFRDALIDLCDELTLRDAIFCGISMGSALSLMVAAERPDLCRYVIAVRPAWLTDADPANLSLIARIGDLFATLDAADVFSEIEADPTFRRIAQDVSNSAISILGAISRANAKEHAPVLSAMVRDAPFARLAEVRKVTCPVCVVGTNADALHPIELARQTSNALPNARLEILPPRYLEPAAHTRALRALIEDVVVLMDGEEHDYQAG